MWLGLSLIDWIVIAGALLGIAGLGISRSRRIHNQTDFFMGGRRFGKVFMVFFSFPSGTSGDDAVSTTAGTWRAGLAGIWWTFLWIFSQIAGHGTDHDVLCGHVRHHRDRRSRCATADHEHVRRGQDGNGARLGFAYDHLMKRFCTIAWTFIGLAGVVWYLSPDLSTLDPDMRASLMPGGIG